MLGLLSLTIEFYRTNPTPCLEDDHGNPISSKASNFPYSDAPSCSLTCSVEDGPHSPLRRMATKDIYIVPAPDTMSFGTATILSAACSVNALVWLAYMWDKILETNSKSRLHRMVMRGHSDESDDEPIQGTNGATRKQMRGVNQRIGIFLLISVIPVFGGACLAILIWGEINMFSHQLSYQTEPIASVG